MNSLIKKRAEQGFTLIELMIVVAIIGILAAIAIPQFQQYRIKAMNDAALADLRNLMTGQEALYAAFSSYGVTQDAATLGPLVAPRTRPALAAAIAAPVLIDGRVQANTIAATDLSAGSGLVVVNASNAEGYAVSNGVQIRSDAEAVFPAGSAVTMAKHVEGTRTYGADTDSSTVVYCDGGDLDRTRPLFGQATCTTFGAMPAPLPGDQFAGPPALFNVL